MVVTFFLVNGLSVQYLKGGLLGSITVCYNHFNTVKEKISALYDFRLKSCIKRVCS